MSFARLIIVCACSVVALGSCGGSSPRGARDSGESSGSDAASPDASEAVEPDDAAAQDDAAGPDANLDGGPTDATTVEPIDAAVLTQDPNWAWVALPAGSFEMGGGNEDPPSGVPLEIFIPDAPKHTVNVPAFEMLRAEVTVAQYRLCVRAGACTPPDLTGESANGCSPSSKENNWLESGRDDYPVNCISPAQGAEFCAWSGGRLPSEAEWEYAARSAGKARLYAWGDVEPDCTLAVFSKNCSGGATCECGGQASPVCSKPSGNTEQGLCDITGNVNEPVADDFHLDYQGAPTDGSAWGAFATQGIMRGGHYGDSRLALLRVTARTSHAATATSRRGVRCVR